MAYDSNNFLFFFTSIFFFCFQVPVKDNRSIAAGFSAWLLFSVQSQEFVSGKSKMQEPIWKWKPINAASRRVDSLRRHNRKEIWGFLLITDRCVQYPSWESATLGSLPIYEFSGKIRHQPKNPNKNFVDKVVSNALINLLTLLSNFIESIYSILV